MDQDCEQRIFGVISAVFDVPVEELSDELGPENVKGWDSMALISLVLAFEAEFGVQLPPEDATELRTVGQIKSLLAEHGVGS